MKRPKPTMTATTADSPTAGNATATLTSADATQTSLFPDLIPETDTPIIPETVKRAAEAAKKAIAYFGKEENEDFVEIHNAFIDIAAESAKNVDDFFKEYMDGLLWSCRNVVDSECKKEVRQHIRGIKRLVTVMIKNDDLIPETPSLYTEIGQSSNIIKTIHNMRKTPTIHKIGDFYRYIVDEKFELIHTKYTNVSTESLPDADTQTLFVMMLVEAVNTDSNVLNLTGAKLAELRGKDATDPAICHKELQRARAAASKLMSLRIVFEGRDEKTKKRKKIESPICTLIITEEDDPKDEGAPRARGGKLSVELSKFLAYATKAFIPANALSANRQRNPYTLPLAVTLSWWVSMRDKKNQDTDKIALKHLVAAADFDGERVKKVSTHRHFYREIIQPIERDLKVLEPQIKVTPIKKDGTPIQWADITYSDYEAETVYCVIDWPDFGRLQSQAKAAELEKKSAKKSAGDSTGTETGTPASAAPKRKAARARGRSPAKTATGTDTPVTPEKRGF